MIFSMQDLCAITGADLSVIDNGPVIPKPHTGHEYQNLPFDMDSTPSHSMRFISTSLF
jgi:hypothetical protein